MIRQIPGPGTDPRDWHHDMPAPAKDYAPTSLRYVRKVTRRSPRAIHLGDMDAWRKYKGNCGRGRWRGVETAGVWMRRST